MGDFFFLVKNNQPKCIFFSVKIFWNVKTRCFDIFRTIHFRNLIWNWHSKYFVWPKQLFFGFSFQQEKKSQLHLALITTYIQHTYLLFTKHPVLKIFEAGSRNNIIWLNHTTNSEQRKQTHYKQSRDLKIIGPSVWWILTNKEMKISKCYSVRKRRHLYWIWSGRKSSASSLRTIWDLICFSKE